MMSELNFNQLKFMQAMKEKYVVLNGVMMENKLLQVEMTT